MAITVNTTDTFEQWRVKTNQLSSDVDSNIAALRSDISSNVSALRSDISSNVSLINTNITGNATALRSDISSNVSSILANINSATGNVVTGNIVVNLVSRLLGNVEVGTLSQNANLLLRGDANVTGNVTLFDTIKVSEFKVAPRTSATNYIKVGGTSSNIFIGFIS